MSKPAFKLAPAAAPSARSIASSRAARNGRAAEDIWHISHERCLSMGLAYVHKTEAPRVIAGGKHIFVRKAGADYRGVMLDGTNRVIAAEAKSTTEASLGLAHEGHGLLPHQVESLSTTHLAGGLALVLLVFRTRLRTRCFVLPWTQTAKGTRVCKLADPDLAQWEVEPGSAYLSRWYRVEL